MQTQGCRSMAEQRVTFMSKGLTLAGAVKVPDGVKPGERRPAFILVQGFGRRMIGENVPAALAKFGPLRFHPNRFELPGWGGGGGEKGLLLCLDQVQATSDAL